MSLKFSEIKSWKINGEEITQAKLKKTGDLLWDKIRYRYVSLGDSIAAGQGIDEGDIYWVPEEYAKWQFPKVDSTVIIDGTYTDQIRAELGPIHGEGYAYAASFARSGDTVRDLMLKLDDERVLKELSRAKLVTICIGANDILGCVSEDRLWEYAMSGSLDTIETEVKTNLENLANPNYEYSYKKLLDKLTTINPNARYAFTTVYNPYKYLHIDGGSNGFFASLLIWIPKIPLDIDGYIEDMFGIPDLGYPDFGNLGKWTSIELDINLGDEIKKYILSTPIFELVYDRVNKLGSWVEPRVNSLNDTLRSAINDYKSTNSNFYLAETKAEFDRYPDRTGPALNGLHYNDLVNVELTAGFDLSEIDWGALWRVPYGNNVKQYFLDLAWNHIKWASSIPYDSNGWPSTNVLDYVSFDMKGFAYDLMIQILNKVIVPECDPHPEDDGHNVLKDAFDSAFGNDYTK